MKDLGERSPEKKELVGTLAFRRRATKRFKLVISSTCDGNVELMRSAGNALPGTSAGAECVLWAASRSLNNGRDEPLRGKARHEFVAPYETFGCVPNAASSLFPHKRRSLREMRSRIVV
jgi:hypothetical protein